MNWLHRLFRKSRAEIRISEEWLIDLTVPKPASWEIAARLHCTT